MIKSSSYLHGRHELLLDFDNCFVADAERMDNTSKQTLSYKQKLLGKSLTLKLPITTAADDNFCDIFPILSE